MTAAPDEFALIAELFAPLSSGYPGALGLTDDAAIIGECAGSEIIITVDAIVAGVHFFSDDPADLVARKLIRVNLSDLAAKGARPFAVLLAAAFPIDVGREWLEGFAAGLRQDLERWGVALIGGDTVATPGPLTLSLTALGRAGPGGMVRRSGGRAGDTLWVSGTIGDGALGLKVLRGELAGLSPDHATALVGRYRLPEPRVELGRELAGLVHAGMDVSDGLDQDLGHLCRASGVAATIEAALVPLSPAARAALLRDRSLLASLLQGGDDYELLFAAPASAEPALRNAATAVGVPITPIGRLAEGEGVRVVDESGAELALSSGGWRHFRGV